jgi:hypothetical protein
MATPFIYGRLAKSDNFTNRKVECALPANNFTGSTRINVGEGYYRYFTIQTDRVARPCI